MSSISCARTLPGSVSAPARPMANPDHFVPMTRMVGAPRLTQSGADPYPRWRSPAREVCFTVYAIVRTGGHQHRVAVGDTLQVDRVTAAPGESVTLPALLLVDDAGSVTSQAAALAKTKVTAEVVDHGKGPKIIIHKFRNKT